MRSRRVGAALMTIMLCMVVLLTMIKALVTVAHSRANSSRLYVQRAQAQCLVEAAVAYARRELDDDADWQEAVSESFPDMRGKWSVAFGKGPALSVNNMRGSAPENGPRGKSTVPPYSLDLVVRVEVEGFEQQVEVLITKKSLLNPYGLTASGRIYMQGEVRIDGAQSLGGKPSRTGIRSYQKDTGATDVIRWRPGPKAGTAEISGVVSTVSGEKDAIDFGSDASLYSVEEFVRGAPPRPLPDVDILAEIAQHTTESAPEIKSLGTTKIEGKAYHKGDLELNGDLRLKSGRLYVGGDLKVNGSIKGTGAVYVAGKTRFKGDSIVHSDQQMGVALYSHGSVKLTGFDGSEFIKALAKDDPEVGTLYGKLDSGLSKGDNLDDRDVRQLSALTVKLAADDGILDQLKQKVKDSPKSDSRDFMVNKLKFMESVFDDGTKGAKNVLEDDGGTSGSALATFVADGLSDSTMPGADLLLSLFGSGSSVSPYTQSAFALVGMTGPTDSLKKGKIGAKLEKLMNAASQISYDKIGMSYFRGAVHTNGYLYAANEVTIIGLVWVDDDGTQEPGTTPEGDPIKPGDICLRDGVDLTLDEEYLAAGPLTPIRLSAWLGP